MKYGRWNSCIAGEYIFCRLIWTLSRGGSNPEHSVNVIYCNEILLTYRQGENSAFVRINLFGMETCAQAQKFDSYSSAAVKINLFGLCKVNSTLRDFIVPSNSLLISSFTKRGFEHSKIHKWGNMSYAFRSGSVHYLYPGLVPKRN